MEAPIGTIPVPSKAPSGRKDRNRQLIGFIGRHGVVTIDHVIEALSLPRATAYRRASACIKARLLERLELAHFEPSLLRATPAGLRYADLPLPTTDVAPGSVNHRLRCASTAQLLGEEFGPDQIVTEREIRLHERDQRKVIASAVVGQRPDGTPRLHRPDLAVLSPEQTIAVEVELSPKSPQRLRRIMAAWQKATWVTEIRYYVGSTATRRAVQRAVDGAGASKRIRILDAIPD